MCSKAKFLIYLVVVLGLASGVLADTMTWSNGAAGNSSWCDADNWSPAEEPRGSDFAVIDATSPDRGPVVGGTCDVYVAGIEGPNPAFGHTQVMDINTTSTVKVGISGWFWRDGAGEAIININGSTVITVGGEAFRGTDNGISRLNISGNPSITVDGSFRGADESGSFFINMSGGLLDLGADFLIGDNGGAEINIDGGTILVATDMDMGGLRGSAPITINMTGGLIRVAGVFRFPGSASRGGNIVMNLDGGVVDCNEFVHGGTSGDQPSYTDDWLVDIEQGQLRIAGDVRDVIDANVAAGQITAYAGEGVVVVELIDGNTVVTALPPNPNTATNPNPPDKSTGIDLNTVLSWTPGDNASSHDVYFGTSLSEVENATTSDSVYRGNFGPNTWDPCSNGVELEQSTTYYWRIDEVDESVPIDPESPWKGRVWWFRTQSPIVDENLRVWYKLDDPNGFIATDSSGYDHHGGVDGSANLWNPTEGHDGGSRIFDEDGDARTVIDVPTMALETMDSGVSVLVWLKDNYDKGGDNVVFATGTGGEIGLYHVYAVVPDSTDNVLFRAGDDTNDVLSAPLVAREGWHHFAFVKDEDNDEMAIYYDGKLLASQSGVSDNLALLQGAPFKIGALTYGENWDYEGSMDDFKIYDKALTATEIRVVYRGGQLELAWAPIPGDNVTDVSRDVGLLWSAGDFAVQHDVYFGTNWDDVNDATTVVSLGVYKGRHDIDANSYVPPSDLALNTAYYWRVDEVNDPCVWKGPVWTFTVANFITIDDFESYNDSDPIYSTWSENAGAILDDFYPGDPTHSGEQSMWLWYFNDYGPDSDYSEVGRDLGVGGMDFTQAGVKALTLYFYGNPTNDAGSTEEPYVGIDDGSTYAESRYLATGNPISDIQEEEWHEWNIPISDLNTVPISDLNTVTLTSVQHIYIGFGQRGSSVEGGYGEVYFDDVRLYPPRCRPEPGLHPVYDWSGNCIVDYADIGIMADNWLRTDANLSPVTNPGTTGLVGCWKLDDGSGSIATDSSVYANHGALTGNYSWVSGHENSAVNFSSGRILVPDALQLRPTSQVSASAWLYYTGNPGKNARVLVKGRDNFEAYCIEQSDKDSFSFYVGEPNGTRHFADSNDGDIHGDEWSHVAGTYDGTTVKSYINGQVVGSVSAIGLSLSQDANGLGIANRSDAMDKPFKGTVDEVRVYNRALTDAEVAWLATDGTGYAALRSCANIYDAEGQGAQVINFRDFAKFMTAWMEEKFWPE